MEIHHEKIQTDYSIRRLTTLRNSVFHWHQRVELLYILEDSYLIDIGQRHYRGCPGDLFVIHSGEIHYIRPEHGNGALYVCTFNPTLLHFMQQDIRYIKSYISGNELNCVGISGEIKQILDEMITEKDAQDTWYDVLIRSDILRIYTLLIRNFEREALPAEKDTSKFKVFQEALSYIAGSYTEDITLNDVAAKLNYSPAHVSTMFVTYTGMNFKTYLDSIRINQAANLLKTSEKTVSDIATQCGFANIRTFNNTFRRITGTTPSQFRNSNF